MISVIPHTPPKFNMEPKNEGLEDVFPFHKGDSQVPCSFSRGYPDHQIAHHRVGE